MSGDPSPKDVLSAEMVLVRKRLTDAARADRGLSLHRKEAVLVSALVALAIELCDSETVNLELTRQEETR